MGACFSRSKAEDWFPTAKVISANGELHEYLVPVTVCRVLNSEAAPPSGYFICSSDGLCYEERIEALAPGEELVGNQIYFVLPLSKLEGRLKAPEMAALAVRASLALQKAEERGVGSGGRRRRGRASMRISPMVEVYEERGYDYTIRMNGGYSHDGSGNKSNITRSGSFRRTTRVASSKRAKFAVRSFRMKLSTIHEGTAM